MAANLAIAPADIRETRIPLGRLLLDVRDGALRISFDGVEVVRQIDCPIRDADWRTLPVTEDAADIDASPDALRLDRRFHTTDGSLDGHLRVTATASGTAASVEAALTLTPRRDTQVNRAGFILLHPIADVAGTPLEVRHADGRTEATQFPARISPGQPVFDITGLHHTVRGIRVAIEMEGEVFEMEDQRNWTDASFKTYCRPLGRPRPFTLAAGEPVRQTLRLSLDGAATVAPTAISAPVTATLPAILLAHDPALTGTAPSVTPPGIDGLILRADARAPLPTPPLDVPITLEIVVDTDADIATVAAACKAAGIAPRRVVALPRGYLASHQPEGPWPTPRPGDLLPALRAAFPEAEIGGGMLTNFTEFNRCPPDPAAIDFATFGTTAIVHAADDRSVIESLEAFPAIFASARALAPDRPLHLGLVSIGMRCNPYGSAVAANPDGLRLPMALDDPRQRTPFAAAFAIAAAAEAARAGVGSFAPAMTAGPLGLGPADAPWPIHAAVTALAALSGTSVTVVTREGVTVIRVAGRGLVANLGGVPVEIDGVTIAPCAFAHLGDQA